MDDLIRQTAERVFRDQQDKPDSLWFAMQDNGFTRAWAPEHLGGTGLSIVDGFELIRMAASVNCSVPFAETLLASYLLSSAGLATPDGKFSIVTNSDTEKLLSPFGDTAQFILRLANNQIEYYKINKTSPIDSIGFDPVVEIDLTEVSSIISSPVPHWLTNEVYQQLGALVRSAQICGAMARVLDLCLEHTATREQFGRPLAKFQAIQHLLAEIAGETAACTAALQAAIHTVTLDGAPDLIAIATAKARASEAAGIVSAHAIQAHGAIGYTEEYCLARFIRRLWQWRDDFGSAHQWHLTLGEYYARSESEGLTSDVFGKILS